MNKIIKDVSSAIIICGARYGRYGKPIPVKEAKIKWVSERTGKELKPPKKYPCENPEHQGKRKWFPISEIYVQMWEYTEQELKRIVEEQDYMSLDMPLHIICKECCKKEIKK